MQSLTGVWKLVRLNIRRDRVKLPVAILVTVAMTAASMPALTELYGKQSAQLVYAKTSAESVAARVMGGPIDGASLGAITMVELFLFTALIIAFIASTAVVRHTRQNEEFGRTELTESYPVGRFSQMTAALIVACGASIITGMLIFLVVFPTEGLSLEGSFVMSAALAGVGVSFAFITAILVQLTESSRAANGYAAVAVGIAFVLRGIGDGFGKVSADGLRVESEWPVWLSPIGWGQQTHPFTQENWINLGYFFVFSIFVGVLAYYLVGKRDRGLAIFPTRPGPASAKKSLKSNIALAWRLQKTVLIGWLAFFTTFGAMVGAMAHEFEKLIQELYGESDFGSAFFEQLGNASFEDVFFSSMFTIFALSSAAYAIHALTKMYGEESKGHLEILLASKADRANWVLGHTFWVLLGLVLLFSSVAVSSSIVNSIVADSSLMIVERMGYMFSLLPASLVIAAITVFIYGVYPKMTFALSWVSFAVVFFIFQFTELLKLPQFVENISPFTHLPVPPVGDFKILPFSVISSLALTLFVLGLLKFKHRDIGTV